MQAHNEIIVDQFTRQANAFAAAPAIQNPQALALLLSACNPTAADASLDVACGPGIVVCAFAERVRSAAGIDLTPAMLAKARELAVSKHLDNVSFTLGDAARLPFDDGSFSIVTSRYALHHVTEPARVLKEMLRVCKPGGRVAVMDMIACDDPEKAARFNRMERLRDPSHAAALTLRALGQCFEQAGLACAGVERYTMTVEVEALLDASCPDDGNRDVVRAMIVESLESDAMGVGTHTRDGKVYFSYPIGILAVTKTREVQMKTSSRDRPKASSQTPPLRELRCPLCGEPNGCAPAISGSFESQCWCREVSIPEAVLARVTESSVGKACVCRKCAQAAA